MIQNQKKQVAQDIVYLIIKRTNVTIKNIIIRDNFIFLEINAACAQEVNARVTVLFSQVSSTVDRKVFQTLQIH